LASKRNRVGPLRRSPEPSRPVAIAALDSAQPSPLHVLKVDQMAYCLDNSTELAISIILCLLI